MAFDPAAEIEPRIEDAMREYADPESSMTVAELEDRIERAFRMEYTYEEIRESMDMRGGIVTQSLDGPVSLATVFGKDLEPGESITFEDDFDVDPFEIDPDPWPDVSDETDESLLTDACARFKDWMMGTEPQWVEDDVMMVRGDVEIETFDDAESEMFVPHAGDVDMEQYR